MSTPRAYYNEIDPYAAQWLRNLIASGLITGGEVDERSIVDVRPDDLDGFTRCHFFAGIGVWDYALGIAGWPAERPVWTGSCPCQPFSAAGKGAGFADERHLWPAWHHLIREYRPADVLGEQVAGKDAGPWLDLVFNDLESLGYAVGAAALPACGVGAPHTRMRTWFVANATGDGCEGIQRRTASQVSKNRAPQALDAWHRPGDPFADWRQLLAGSEVRCLAHGTSSNLGVRPALRAYGNSIVPQVGAAFIGAVMEARP